MEKDNKDLNVQEQQSTLLLLMIEATNKMIDDFIKVLDEALDERLNELNKEELE